jgi:hypothetical protein
MSWSGAEFDEVPSHPSLDDLDSELLFGGSTAELEAQAENDPKAAKEDNEFARLEAIQQARHAILLHVHICLGYLIPISLVLAFLLYWAGVLVYAIHMFSHGWLAEDKLHELRAVLFSGFVGAAVSQGIRKYF